VRTFLVVVVVFACGFAAGAVSTESREKPRPGGTVDFTADFSVQPGRSSVRTYRPHSVRVNGERAFLAEGGAPENAEVTSFTFENGRVIVAATEVTERR
jgi:hypothetical protein